MSRDNLFSMQITTTPFYWRMMRKAPFGVSLMKHPYEEAFLKAFDEYADALFRHAFFRISNREHAKDLVQETFLKTWNYIHEGNEVRHWKSFLYQTLNNLIIDEYRRVKEQSLDSLIENSVSDISSLIAVGNRSEKEDRLDDEITFEKIRILIRKLPDAYRVALTMRYVDGLSTKEMATLLNTSENVVSVRTHRALVQLKELCRVAHII